MKLNLIFKTALLFTFAFGITSCEEDKEPLGYSYEEPEDTGDDVPYLLSVKAVDMVMIYDGGEHRPLWTPDKYTGFVSYVDPDTNEEEWLFDGFLFIEVRDGRGHLYSEDGNPTSTDVAAGKKEWEWLLEKHFSKGRGIDALNTQIEQVKGRIGEPERKRKVVYALPVPFWKQTDWGILNGKQLNTFIQ